MKILKMNEYLKAIKRVVVPTVNNVLGVVGNESVDLDSAGKWKKIDYSNFQI